MLGSVYGLYAGLKRNFFIPVNTKHTLYSTNVIQYDTFYHVIVYHVIHHLVTAIRTEV